jgi:hypothetical protein
MTANTGEEILPVCEHCRALPHAAVQILGGEQRRRAIKESEVFTFSSSIKSSVSGSDGFM